MFGDHGAMQVQVDAVQRQGVGQALQDQRADAFKSVFGDRARRAGRGPGSGHERVLAHGFDEARHGNVGACHGLEHRGAADQFWPTAAFLGKIFPRCARRRERIGFVLKAAYTDAHQASPCVV
ncbi:hypothetical protein D3C87_1786670 [compost metagenome]